jgi:hypothetical protein
MVDYACGVLGAGLFTMVELKRRVVVSEGRAGCIDNIGSLRCRPDEESVD